MRENYNEKPLETWLEVLHKVPGGIAIAHLCEDIEEKQDEEDEGSTEAEEKK